MLQFLDGLLVPVDSESVLPGYAEADDFPKHLAILGFDSNQTWGWADCGFSVESWRMTYRAKGEVAPTLFIIELNGQVLEEIYCSDEASALKCLIQIAPLFTTALLSGFMAHLGEAADARDGIISGKYRQKVSEIGDIAGLFLAMAGVDKK